MAASRSWHARFSVLTYLQIMVFYNLFTLLSLPAEVLRIQTLVIQLLLDEQLEVTHTQQQQQQQPKISKSLCDGHLMPPPGVNPYPSLRLYQTT